ncbi:hypothetical protein SPONN_2611 [uncultured Candidatus Thioglobus sp.]|nr:hypothetical protein SPONL_1278 [uncultured Candidatus Thioglobus sp.]SMN01532.1 hypothetical protein SPONN_2611 [uncultured Candidatus Thioglobus sp.]
MAIGEIIFIFLSCIGKQSKGESAHSITALWRRLLLIL